MNIERIYTTATTPEKIAQTLAIHFRAQGFEAQVFGTTDNRTAMQARKDSLWRQALGVAYAVTVVIARRDGQLLVNLGEHATASTRAPAAGQQATSPSAPPRVAT